MSSFDLKRQEKSVESKIVVALERLSEAFRVLLWNESKETSLSPIQIQILIFIVFHSQEKCKVGYLSNEFNMTKATISDSVKVLLQKGLIKKITDEADTRSYTISLTEKGEKIALKASSFTSAIEKPINKLTANQKEVILLGLQTLIGDLNRSGVITIQRMCFSCINYRFENNTHYCKLLQSKLTSNELRIDCPEHE